MGKAREVLRTQVLEAGQTENEMRTVKTCRYLRSIHPTRRCPAYGMKCGECGRKNHFSAVCRASGQATCTVEEQEDGQNNRVNMDHFIYNSIDKGSSIETKLNTSSFYNSINVTYKLDTGRNYNSILFHIYKTLFPKAANKGKRQIKDM